MTHTLDRPLSRPDVIPYQTESVNAHIGVRTRPFDMIPTIIVTSGSLKTHTEACQAHEKGRDP